LLNCADVQYSLALECDARLAIPAVAQRRQSPLRNFSAWPAEDLLALVFPDQLACAENPQPVRLKFPAHPLVEQTVRDCLKRPWISTGLERLLESIERG
jgi:ATP-dependent Lhr-like helicase